MNTYIALCLMAVLGLTQGIAIGGYAGYGYGSPWYYPAVSSVNVYRAPIAYKPVGWYGYGWAGQGWNGNSWAGPGWNGYGWGGYGKWGGLGGWRGSLGWGWNNHH